MEKGIAKKDNYSKLINSISSLLEQSRKVAFRQLNRMLVKTYWQIGQHIVVYEQANQEKAEYGTKLLKELSFDLKQKHGKGFSQSNVYLMRLFYLKYPIFQTVSGKLSWSHHVELLGVLDDLARSFYEKESIRESWSIRELKRQINSMLFERLALSKDKKGLLKLIKKGQIAWKEGTIIKDPYILEFLKIPENYRCNEKELEQKIIDNLQMFLLELGKGFTLAASDNISSVKLTT